MNVIKEEVGSSLVQLIVEVDEARLEESKQVVARKVAKNVKIPGFRPGRAPYHMIVRAVGEEALLQDAVEALVPELLTAAIVESEVEPFSPDTIEVHLHAQSPLTLRFVVPTVPTVQLGDIGMVTIDMQDVEVDDARVDEVLESLRQEKATLEPTLGPAAYGDQATVDLLGQLKDGSTLEDQKGVEITLLNGHSDEEDESLPADPSTALIDHIVGMLVNQVKEVPIVYPADWQEERLQNRTVLYKVTLLDLKRRNEAELNDEFAQEVGDFDSLDALRERIRLNLQAEGEEEEFNRQLEAALDGFVDEADLSYPEVMVQIEVERRIHNLEHQIQAYGISIEQYLEVMGKTREDLENDLWEDSTSYVARSLVLSEYVQHADLQITPDEIERELDLVLASYHPAAAVSMRNRLMQSEEDMAQVRNRLLTRKALLELHHQVTGEERRPLFPDGPEVAEWMEETFEEPEAEEALTALEAEGESASPDEETAGSEAEGESASPDEEAAAPEAEDESASPDEEAAAPVAEEESASPDEEAAAPEAEEAPLS